MYLPALPTLVIDLHADVARIERTIASFLLGFSLGQLFWGPVLARATVRDLYARERSAQMLSVLILMMAVAPLIGPLLGGQIIHFWNWRVIFGVLAAAGVATLLAYAVSGGFTMAAATLLLPVRHSPKLMITTARRVSMA